MEGVLLDPPHPSFSQAPLRSAPGLSTFPHGDASRRPPCLLHWGLGGILSFKGRLLPIPYEDRELSDISLVPFQEVGTS
jgi:hypothetical protein